MREESGDKERVLLVGADTGEEQNFDRTMEELMSLAEACEMQVAGLITQKMDAVNKALYIGSGKVKEVKEFAREVEADLVVFDNGLSPSQIRNLNEELGLPVMDRNNLILDIFATRARTREAKLQAETARLQYLLPRLAGLGAALSRQGGASGSMSSKGAGETKLELDRRKIEHRISELKKELEVVARGRSVQREKRAASPIPQVALVGYTNAGKSTILNRMVDLYWGAHGAQHDSPHGSSHGGMHGSSHDRVHSAPPGEVRRTPSGGMHSAPPGGTHGHGTSPVEEHGIPSGKKVLEEDMLFATLETSVRNIETGDHRPFLLVDTVGFIHKLPHGLVKAFRSTLEEVKYADLLVQVVDVSDSEYRQQMDVTAETLKDLGAGGIPMIYVYNKADKRGMEALPRVRGDQIYMAAAAGIGIPELAEMIQDRVYAGRVAEEFLIPYDKGTVVSYLCGNATVLAQEYREEGTYLKVSCHRQDAERYRAYRLGGSHHDSCLL